MAATPSRKLAVILHADVVGSTTLVQKDESLAHARIQAAFQRLAKTSEAYNGTAQEIRGDALVAEFSRASDAVCAALGFQAENADHNRKLPDNIRPELRVGVSLGEVVIGDGTITGAGVVLAQRLEQLAEPGGVVVQGSVSETVPIRLPFAFESLGEQILKGFEQPVRAFVVKLKSGEPLPAPESNADIVSQQSRPDEGSGRPMFELPDKPSIAVLPFTNMSSDSEHEHFSDGITEDIITELSRFRELFVIASNSTFRFKGKDIDIAQIANRLGVQYMVEGSVRRSGKRVRITAQLVDALSGSEVWADRYDRDLDDIFVVQDEVVAAIAGALPGRVRHAELERADRLVLSGTRVGYSGAAAEDFARRVSDFESLSAEEFGRTRAMTMVSSRAPDAVREAVAEVAAEIRRDGYLDGVTLLGKTDNRVVLAGLDLPTLAIGGGDDVIAPPSCLEAIAAIVTGARLERIEGVAHAAYIEAPERYNALLLDFLTEDGRKSAG